jgi:hypothetical protein
VNLKALGSLEQLRFEHACVAPGRPSDGTDPG